MRASSASDDRRSARATSERSSITTRTRPDASGSGSAVTRQSASGEATGWTVPSARAPSAVRRHHRGNLGREALGETGDRPFSREQLLRRGVREHDVVLAVDDHHRRGERPEHGLEQVAPAPKLVLPAPHLVRHRRERAAESLDVLVAAGFEPRERLAPLQAVSRTDQPAEGAPQPPAQALGGSEGDQHREDAGDDEPLPRGRGAAQRLQPQPHHADHDAFAAPNRREHAGFVALDHDQRLLPAADRTDVRLGRRQPRDTAGRGEVGPGGGDERPGPVDGNRSAQLAHEPRRALLPAVRRQQLADRASELQAGLLLLPVPLPGQQLTQQQHRKHGRGHGQHSHPAAEGPALRPPAEPAPAPLPEGERKHAPEGERGKEKPRLGHRGPDPWDDEHRVLVSADVCRKLPLPDADAGPEPTGRERLPHDRRRERAKRGAAAPRRPGAVHHRDRNLDPRGSETGQEIARSGRRQDRHLPPVGQRTRCQLARRALALDRDLAPASRLLSGGIDENERGAGERPVEPQPRREPAQDHQPLPGFEPHHPRERLVGKLRQHGSRGRFDPVEAREGRLGRGDQADLPGGVVPADDQPGRDEGRQDETAAGKTPHRNCGGPDAQQRRVGPHHADSERDPDGDADGQRDRRRAVRRRRARAPPSPRPAPSATPRATGGSPADARCPGRRRAPEAPTPRRPRETAPTIRSGQRRGNLDTTSAAAAMAAPSHHPVSSQPIG